MGGGLILDGQLYRGAIGAAAELGHITLDLNGPPCQGRCPGRGHLEALASGTAADGYAREAAERNPDGDLGRAAAEGMTVDARLAVELAANGPGDARDVLDHVGLHLGVGIATFVNVFNPELVVLGGGFARAETFSSSRPGSTWPSTPSRRRATRSRSFPPSSASRPA